MAIIEQPTPEQQIGWNEWVESRPENVREVARRFNPWTLYRLGSSGHRVTILSFGEQEDGSVTLTVAVTGQFNLVIESRRVFGIKPEDLTECDLPAAYEPVGAILSQDEVMENLDEIRLRVRPDLWRRAEDGSVVRKDTN